jgi:formate dehydrogenase subunit beta
MGQFYKLDDFKEFLIALKDNKIVDAVFVPVKTLLEDNYSPFLIKDKNILKDCTPLSPIMTINSAKAVSFLTAKGSLPFKTAVVLKPCELRAFIELIKLKQINPENLITISFDCSGIKDLKNRESMREICEICLNFTPDSADIKIYNDSVIESDIDISALNLEKIDFDTQQREKEVSDKKEQKAKLREKKLKSIKNNLKELLKNCISCHNCMRVCPICFCQECFFESSALKGNIVTYSMRATRLKGLEFPENKLLFQLGRMNHMSVSCVGCGACEDACPAQIPVSQMFTAAGDELKKLFNYEPGRKLEEKIPFTCYEHDELHNFEQPYTEKRQ